MKTLVAIFMFIAVIGCKPQKPAIKVPEHNVAVDNTVKKGDLVLAMIGRRKITFSEVKRVRDRMPIVQKLMFTGKKGLRKLVESYVEMLIFAMEGKKAGLDRSPMVMEGIRRFEALEYLKHLIQNKVGNPDYSVEILRKFYDVHSDYFHLPERHKCLDIHISDEKKIHVVYNRLSIAFTNLEINNPEQVFKDFVKRYSEDAGKSMDGPGFLPRVGPAGVPVAPEVVKQAAKMEMTFSISNPFKASDGYHILFLQRKKPAVNMDFASAMPKIKNILKKQAEAKSGRAIVSSLLSKAKIKINNEVLDEIK